MTANRARLERAVFVRVAGRDPVDAAELERFHLELTRAREIRGDVTASSPPCAK